MKRLFSIAILLLSSLVALAQADHFFTYETGSFDLVMNMSGQKMTTHAVFADYGALQITEMDMMGQKVKTLSRDGKNYMLAPKFQEIPQQEAVNYNALTPEVIEQYGIQMVGFDSAEGFDCMVYTLTMEVQGMEAKSKVWVWEGFPIRTESTVMGMKMVTTIKNLELDIPVDKSLFALPE